LPEPQLTPDELEIVRAADEAFDQMCQARHETGRTKYGILTFIEMPTLEMALEELADLANYSRYTFIKVALLRYRIGQAQEQSLGNVDGFFTTPEILGIKKDVE
jgi:hypothetical protein